MPTIERVTTDQEFFHSYMVDSRGKFVNKSKITSFEASSKNGLRMFCSDLDDPQRTNMDHGCCIADDSTFFLKSIRIEARFSNPYRFTDFARTTRFILSVGDKPMYILEANSLADPAVATGTTNPESDFCSNGVDVKVTEELERMIAIPPRQCFDGLLETHPIFSEQMKLIESGAVREFAEIKIVLCGDLRVPSKQPLTELLLDDYEKTADKIESPNKQEPKQGYRGYGNPEDIDFLDIFCESLMDHLKIHTSNGKTWSSDKIRMAVQNCISTFPIQQQPDGSFLIPPPATEKAVADDELIETEAEKEFFIDQQMAPEGPSDKWDPAAYLKNRKG